MPGFKNISFNNVSIFQVNVPQFLKSKRKVVYTEHSFQSFCF